jgi:CubicO group peptidase (beta-lactamase class C family)
MPDIRDVTLTRPVGRSAGDTFPLETETPEELGFHEPQLDRLRALIAQHIAEGRYPGAQIALARHGQLALFESFGSASLEPRTAAGERTLWLLFSNTKVITAAGVWALVEDGAITFSDRIAAHIPEFARHGKNEVTLAQLLSHRGGFPSHNVSPEAWTDHERMVREVCDFTLEWTPGSRVQYHSRSALWVAAALIETLTGGDYRDFLRARIMEPLGIANELFVGLPDAEHSRVATIYEPDTAGRQTPLASENTAPHRRAGIPSSGGHASARAMAAFYQMMANGGELEGRRIFSRRLVEYVTRNHSGEMVDHGFGMPMHRGLGVHVRGTTDAIRGLGTLASPATFGHGGVGSSYCWADPDSGVSFAYLTNSRIPDPWHTRRLDLVANLVHAAIV